jgi:hypothetical protein
LDIMMMMMTIKSIFLLVASLSLSAGFAPRTAVPTTARPSTARHIIGQEFASNIDESRTAFFIWFFGASGAAGIARSAFPRMFKQVTYIQGLKEQGPTMGGETLGLSPLCGYPEDLKVKDVEQILNNKLSVERVVEKYPIEDNFLSRKGYLTFAAFEQANGGANPLALRAIFDTFAQSTDCCNPDIAQQKIDSYKEDVTRVNGALTYAKLSGYSAIFVLLFLLGLADIVAAGHAWHGWFPEWPGGNNFPWCIFDKETGPLTIPNYWI